ncbi:MAG TPA: PadR family transcriptional regulator [Ktedonobacteraceae bacterium]|nr:PadR family transcriptional regulator [Ktedonobacteraceae bacterium]
MSHEQFDALPVSDDGTLPGENKSSSAIARKALMYELFVLGELMDGPHYGYILRDILGRLLGPFRHISWGVLYPLIRHLESGGLIVPDEKSGAAQSESTQGNKQRKQYRITEAGQRRFLALMLETGNYTADYPELFLIKLNNLDHITREQKLTLLWHYREYLQVEQKYLQESQRDISKGTRFIPEDQRAHVFDIIGFRLSGIQAEITWIARKIADLESEKE